MAAWGSGFVFLSQSGRKLKACHFTLATSALLNALAHDAQLILFFVRRRPSHPLASEPKLDLRVYLEYRGR